MAMQPHHCRRTALIVSHHKISPKKGLGENRSYVKRNFCKDFPHLGDTTTRSHRGKFENYSCGPPGKAVSGIFTERAFCLAHGRERIGAELALSVVVTTVVIVAPYYFVVKQKEIRIMGKKVAHVDRIEARAADCRPRSTRWLDSPNRSTAPAGGPVIPYLRSRGLRPDREVLLAELLAENAELRHKAVNLALEIAALAEEQPTRAKRSEIFY
jgi:hypothetical protein